MARFIGAAGSGVPQDTDRVDALDIEWTTLRQPTHDTVAGLLDLLLTTLPEAAPVRFGPFEPLQYERFEDAITVDADELLDMYSTTSSLAALEPDERATLFAQVQALLAGPYRLPLKHELVWTRLR